MTSQSPLKAKPLPNPGDSTDREIRGLADDKLVEALFFAGGFSLVALMEWIGYLTHSPRHPALFTGVALLACIIGAWRVRQIRRRLRQLRLGRDGERCVGQFPERLHNGGSRVFHDIPAPGFNLDHVIISSHGVFAVETKTFTKPSRRAVITVESNALLVAGRRPDRNPKEQAASAAR
jgi:Nuclease-related domain